ncbi:hypothetical protein ACHAWF_003085 [Thalassiosira exigua]
MHGQKRSEYKSRLLNPEVSSKLATKAQQWNHLSHELLAQRRRLFAPPPPVGGAGGGGGDGVGDGEDEGDGASPRPHPPRPSPEVLLTLTEKMLSVNPDPSHLWNVRREMLLYAPATAKEGEGDAGDPGSPSSSSDDPSTTTRPPLDVGPELTLTANCLRRNPKAYSAWCHRKWSLAYGLANPTVDKGGGDGDGSSSSPESNATKLRLHWAGAAAILRSELDLCAQFLEMDERNFHCWNYRRFVVALLGSCGGSGDDAPEVASESKSASELFGGSWSAWLNQSQVTMGAQLAPVAIAAVGKIASSEVLEGEETCISKSINPLSKQELEEIITDEWEFTTAKIQDNFSNGSAFHYRSKLLPLILESQLSSADDEEGGTDDPSPSERSSAMVSLARDEWERIVLNAVFTEPDDQTPWWYHRFVVSWAKPGDDADDEVRDDYEGLLFEMADSLRDLLEVEREGGGGAPGSGEGKDESKGAKCKWGYLGLHLVLSALLESNMVDEEELAELRREAGECLSELMRIDPNRKERYQKLASEINGA